MTRPRVRRSSARLLEYCFAALDCFRDRHRPVEAGHRILRGRPAALAVVPATLACRPRGRRPSRPRGSCSGSRAPRRSASRPSPGSCDPGDLSKTGIAAAGPRSEPAPPSPATPPTGFRAVSRINRARAIGGSHRRSRSPPRSPRRGSDCACRSRRHRRASPRAWAGGRAASGSRAGRTVAARSSRLAAAGCRRAPSPVAPTWSGAGRACARARGRGCPAAQAPSSSV